jgi:hypothetical protein
MSRLEQMSLWGNRSTSLRPEVHFAARRFENAVMGVETMAGKSAVGRNPVKLPEAAKYLGVERRQKCF